MVCMQPHRPAMVNELVLWVSGRTETVFKQVHGPFEIHHLHALPKKETFLGVKDQLMQFKLEPLLSVHIGLCRSPKEPFSEIRGSHLNYSWIRDVDCSPSPRRLSTQRLFVPTCSMTSRIHPDDRRLSHRRPM